MSDQGIQLREGLLLEGKYLLERELGAGGMGQVFLARDTRIDRLVAIKILHRELASDPAVRRRFETEARAIGKLRHPNCVLLYEFGYSDELSALFAIFEYAEGKSLESWVGQQLPVGHVLEIGRQVAEGMHHAHDQKIIHRDLKPDNIMVSFDEEGHLNARVLDFGIARIAEDDEKNTRLTKMGQMFGTPPYMSPEQIRAKLDVGPRTDIYSIGVILFEMLEGELPFIGGSAIETCMSHLNDEVPPMQRPDVPEELRQIVNRCLEKHADDRFESCKKLARALEDVEWSRTETMPGLPAVVGLVSEEQRPDTGVALGQRSTGGEMSTAPTLLDASGSYSAQTGVAGEAEEPPEEEAEAAVVPAPTPVAPAPTPEVQPATVLQPAQEARDAQVMTYAPTNRKPLVVIGLILLVVLLLSVLGLFLLTDGKESDETLMSEEGEAVALEQEPVEPLLAEEPGGQEAEGEAPVEEDEIEEVEVVEVAEELEEGPEEVVRPAPATERPTETRPQEPQPVARPTTRPQPREEARIEEATEPTSIRLEGRRRGGSSQEQEESQEPAGLRLPESN